MRVPHFPRGNVLLIGLFVTAFFGMLLFSKSAIPDKQSTHAGTSASHFGLGPVLRRHRRSDSGQSLLWTTDRPKHDVRAAPPPLTAVQIREYQQAGREAMEAEEGEDRGVAIRKLENAATPESVAALVHALRDDPDVRNRLLAIGALSSLAHSGYDDPRIRAELESAARESDGNIANHAEEALGEMRSAGEQRPDVEMRPGRNQ